MKVYLDSVSYKTEDRSQPEKEGEATEETCEELDPFRGLRGRGQGVRAISL